MFLYIDPGTGSMLFSILIGIVSTAVFFSQRVFIKLKFVISGGRSSKISKTKIPYVIFSDDKRYWNVFKPICDEFEKRGINLTFWTASKDDPALEQKYNHIKTEFIGEGNKAFSRLNLMNVGTVISTTPGLDVYQWKKSKNVDTYIHVFHSVSDGTGYRMFGLEAYDVILAGGSIVKKYLDIISQKRGLPQKEIAITGITYMDILKSRLTETEQKITHNIKSNEKTVLLAPSWGSSAILSKYGENIINALLKTDYKIIIRPHPQSAISEKKLLDSLMARFPQSNKLEWNFDNDNFEVLYKSDIMISDFSGVIYDYAFVFNKPVIYAEVNFNSAPYDAAWIDEEKWMIQKLPSLGYPLNEKDFCNIQNVLDKAITSNTIKASRNEVKKLCWANEGNAAKSITEYIINRKAK